MIIFPSALDVVYLTEICGVAKSCYERGWSYGTAGNFSIRSSSNANLVWQSQTALVKGDLQPQMFAPVDLRTQKVRTEFPAKISAEAPVHFAIYNVVGQAKSVVHTHPTHIVRASRGRSEFVFQGEEMAKCLGVKHHNEKLAVKIHANIEDMTGLNLEKLVDKNSPVIILQGHGVYAWGISPKQALSYIEALEYLCQTNF